MEFMPQPEPLSEGFTRREFALVHASQQNVGKLRTASAQQHLRVLCCDDGTPLTRQTVQSRMLGAARRAKLPNSGVHILRHTFCSHLAMRGAQAKAIQELAGHQDLSTTQRYMHLSPAALDAAIPLLDGAGSALVVEK